MKEKQNIVQQNISLDTWNEELFRSKKFNEAAQKRNALLLAQKELKKREKKTVIGRLKIEA